MKKFEETQQMNFGFLRTEKSSKTQEKLSKIIEDREKTLQFDHFRANPLPKAQVRISHRVERKKTSTESVFSFSRTKFP